MASAAPRSEGFLTLLRKKNFLLLWLAQLISMTILNASNYALISLIQQDTGSTTLIGLAIICFSLPAVIFGAPAGVFVDHRNKKRVLFYSNWLRAIASVGFVLSLLWDRTQLIPIYLLTFLISGIGQFFTPAEGATIPMMVSENELMPALSLFQVTFMLSTALGYILFAPLLLLFLPTFTLFSLRIMPVEMLYFIIAVLYGVCAILISAIPTKNFVMPRRRETTTSELTAESLGVLENVWHEMVQAWTFIRRRPMLFESVIQLSFAGVLLLVIGQLAAPIVTHLLGLPSTSMAFVFAPAGVGLVLSSIVMPRLITALGKSRMVVIGCLALALMIILLPLLTLLARYLEQHGLQVSALLVVVVGVVMFLAGVAINFINIPANTSMQERTPDWIKGRVLALQLVIYNTASIPIVLLIGVITDHFTLPTMLYVLAICVVAFGMWGVFYERKPHRREHEVEEERLAEKEVIDEIIS
jgi:MFS family permease